MLHIIHKTNQEEINHYFSKNKIVLLMSISIQLYGRFKDISQNPCFLVLCKTPHSKVLVGVLTRTEFCCENILLD